MRRRRFLFDARPRILAAFVVLLALSTLVSTVALRQLLFARVDQRVEDSLVQEVGEFRRLVRDGRDPRTGRPFGGNVQAIFDVFLSRNLPHEGEELFTFLGTRPYRSTASSGADRQVLAEATSLGRVTGSRRGTLSDGRLAYLAVPVTVDGQRRGAFVVTVDLGQEREEVGEAVRIAAGVSLAVLLVASVLAWFVAGGVLAPLRDLRDTARGITDTDLSRRIDVRGQDEIAELGRTFNEMLDRLEQAFASQRAFVSDAGHELRTPITIIRGHLEVMGEDPAERRETIALVTDELDRMGRLVDELLVLAKAERRDFLHPEDLDLDVLGEELFSKARGLGERDWRLARLTPGRITADRQRLTQAVMNLARNAVEHTGEGDPIELGAEARNGEARLWVRDHGPGVPEGDRARIFERFARAERGGRRSDGAGLGLAIVRAIALAHGGRVELDTQEGRGATFTVVVPRERGEPS